MKIITQRTLLRDIYKNWMRKHVRDITSENLAISMALMYLDTDKTTVEQVTRITGDSKWSTIICSECGETCTYAICFGEETIDGNKPILLCSKCLQKAVKLMNETEIDFYGR